MNPYLYVVFPYDVAQPFEFDLDLQINSQGFFIIGTCVIFEPKRIEGSFIKL